MSSENLLFYQAMKVLYDNGVKYLIPQENEGFEKIRKVLNNALIEIDSEQSSVTIAHFRKLFKLSWEGILDKLVPYEARNRVTKEFKSLLF